MEIDLLGGSEEVGALDGGGCLWNISAAKSLLRAKGSC